MTGRIPGHPLAESERRMQDKKRRFPRLERHLLVSYDHFNVDNVKDDVGMARTLDMSVRGLLLELARPVEIGSSLRLSLDLDGEVVEAFGDVARCESTPDGLYAVGVDLRYVPERFIERVEAHFRLRETPT